MKVINSERNPGEPGSMQHDILTVEELAEYLRIHRSTIYRLLKARKLPGFRVGSDYRFTREQIDEWRMRQVHSGQTEQPNEDPTKDKP